MQLYPSAQSSSKNIFLSILTKDFLKTEIELFPQYAISHENYSFSQIFCPWLETKFSLCNWHRATQLLCFSFGIMAKISPNSLVYTFYYTLLCLFVGWGQIANSWEKDPQVH